MIALLQVLLFGCIYFDSMAQSTSYNFRHITTSDGLSNGIVRSLGQDKYGYMWVGTLSGLCRYNGYSVQTFLHADIDSFSVPDNFAQAIFCDRNKKLWISFQSGLYGYNYNNGRFTLLRGTKNISIIKMIQVGDDAIYCVSEKGLALFHPSDGSFSFPSATAINSTKVLLQKQLSDIFLSKKGLLYLATDTGLVIYHPHEQKADYIPLKHLTGQGIQKVAVDEQENTWVSFGSNGESVLRVNSNFSDYNLFPKFLISESNIFNSRISNFFIDDHGRIWICTTGMGLCLYDSASNSFARFGNNPLLLTSISSYNITDIFQDKQGFIWVGTEGYGLNYFHPDDNLFHSIFPKFNRLNTFTDNWSRAVAEDKDGNLWLGSINGVACLNRKGAWTILQNKKNEFNVLYSNSVRALLYDDHGYLWIGTGQGLNRYNPLNGHMDFFGDKNSVPQSFFWTIFQDHKKNIWMGCRDGLYRYSYATNVFEHFKSDSLLSRFHDFNILTIFEDSRNNLWFGCYKKGVIRYDPAAGTVRHWIKTDADPSFINNNIRSFAEDKDGNIWIASNEGIAAYSPLTGEFKKFEKAGLKTLNTSELMVDRRNRLWIGTGKGLYVLDSARSYYKSFSLRDGLPSLEFNEQSAFKTSSGDFVYPSLKGFLFFNPDYYKERSARVDVCISSIKVLTKDYAAATNTEELNDLHLRYDENFFSLELTAINYGSPEETSYAYKLEPFDKDWIYTKERRVNYTNVPGGNYVLHYKATATEDTLGVPEKIINIHIGTVFYKTNWFRILVVLFAILLLFSIYHYRLKQKERIYSLQNKARELEKEKAIVQYQSLKEQLNPHFLFNSLTSLRSLIRIDRQGAADFLDKLSLNYRYILKSSDNELVALNDELVFAKGYSDMQQSRFGKGLKVNIDVGEEHHFKKIVPVTIQNLIENALKHNLIEEESPLMIDIFEEDNYLLVRNNLQLKDFVETSNKHGLKHMQSLYKYLETRPMVIENDGHYFTVKIPLI